MSLDDRDIYKLWTRDESEYNRETLSYDCYTYFDLLINYFGYTAKALFLYADQLKTYEAIAHSIESHMGQWNTSNKVKDKGIILPKPNDKYQEIVHLADYLASRKPLEMEFDDWKKPELPPIDTFILNFGKYKDKRLVEVASEDRGYIDWLKENYGKEPLRSLLKQL